VFIRNTGVCSGYPCVSWTLVSILLPWVYLIRSCVFWTLVSILDTGVSLGDWYVFWRFISLWDVYLFGRHISFGNTSILLGCRGRLTTASGPEFSNARSKSGRSRWAREIGHPLLFRILISVWCLYWRVEIRIGYWCPSALRHGQAWCAQVGFGAVYSNNIGLMMVPLHHLVQ